MLLHEHTVRFGDISVGGMMHHSKVLDLCIRSLESLCSDFEVSVADIVDDGGVPYAPVDVRGAFTAYPRIDETIAVTGTVLDVGEKHFRVEYDFETETTSLGRAQMVHVTVDAGGGAGSLAESDRSALANRVSEPQSTHPDLPTPYDEAPTAGTTFSKRVTFRSPYIEAAGLGYIEDYFGFISATLEDLLDNTDHPISSLEPAVPVAPVRWVFEFPQPIRFEDEIWVRGRVTDVDDQEFEVQYALTGPQADDVRIIGEIGYECWNHRGESVALPGPLRETLTSDHG